MTPTQQRGYADQQSGMINPALSVADTPEGREYRDGARAARRLAADSVIAANEGNPPPLPSDYLPESPGTRKNATPEPDLPQAGVSGRVGGAFAEPVPGAKKPRKPKAADADQLSLL